MLYHHAFIAFLVALPAVRSLPIGAAHLRRQAPSSSSAAASASNTASSAPTSSSSSVAPPSSSTSSASASAAAPSSAPSAAAVPSSSNSSSPKYVVAHHMVGNTFPYTIDDWKADIALASAAGIDAFALNTGSDPWQPARIADAYSAAEQTNPDFKLFMSFDMSSLPCTSPNDAQTLRGFITQYASHPNQLKMDSRVFASTFAGESCQFGQGSVVNGWQSQFTRHPDLTGQNAVYFVPSFFVDPATFSQYAEVMDGDFNFNSGWPIDLTTNSANSLLSSVGSSLSAIASQTSKAVTAVSGLSAAISNIGKTLAAATNATSDDGSVAQQKLYSQVGSTDTDDQHLSALAAMPAPADGSGKRAYMAAVSPWFYTHYSPQTFDKNFIYLADSHLYPTRWESLIANRTKIDLVEVVTWNDYGESHYIGPIKGSQPNSQAWVDGFNHTGWLDMTSYYATAFKTGSFPQITQDKLYLWARPHPASAQASADGVGAPSNAQLTQDTLWAVAMTTAPATVTLATGPNGQGAQSFDVPAGVTKLSIPLTVGGSMQGSIVRNGQSVVDLQPQGYTFEGSPQTFNFNAFVAYNADS